MDCAVCGTEDELLYRCERCGERFCATHHDRRYHECVGVVPTQRAPRDRTVEPSVDRPDAQLFPEAVEPSADGGVPATTPGDTERPGYEPERRPAEPEAPAHTMREWFRRQTYVSLVVKVGLIASLSSALVFASIVVAFHLSLV